MTVKPPTPGSRGGGAGPGPVRRRLLSAFQPFLGVFADAEVTLSLPNSKADSVGRQQALRRQSQYSSTPQTSQTTSVPLGRGGG